MGEHELEDGVVRLREWADDDAAWYAQSVRDPLIQRFTTDSPALDAGQVLGAIARPRLGKRRWLRHLRRDQRRPAGQHRVVP